VVAATTDLALLDISTPAADSVEETVADALADAGIENAFQHEDLTIVDGTINQTFEGLSDPAVDELQTNGAVAQLTTDGITNLGLEPTGSGIAAYHFIATATAESLRQAGNTTDRTFDLTIEAAYGPAGCDDPGDVCADGTLLQLEANLSAGVWSGPSAPDSTAVPPSGLRLSPPAAG